MSPRILGIASVVSILLGLQFTQAQNNPPGGVYLDGDGVLRWKDSARGNNAIKLKNLRKGKEQADPSLAYVSLPKLFEEAKRLKSQNAEIPADVACVGGMTQIKYVFVYPEEKDLVIAGPAEDIDDSDPYRPVGKSSGRPTLRLDDLALCLKILGPGKKPTVVGCSLELGNGALGRMQQAAAQIGGVTGFNDTAVGKALERAAGLQEVRLFGVPPDTNAAYVCIEADYVMKRLAQGKSRSPVKAVKSFIALMRANDPAYNRWWFVPNYESVSVAEDGLAFELKTKGLKVNCSGAQGSDQQPAGPAATKFAELVTEHFLQLQESIPSFADLSNLCDLTVLAALIRQEGLDRKTGWDTSWVMSETGYKIPERSTPREVESVTAHKKVGRSLAIAVGGVTFSGDQATKNLSKDASISKYRKKAVRPTKGWIAKADHETIASTK